MFDRRERRIRRTLSHLSKQRVAMRLNHPQAGHNKVWVIELTPTATEETTDDLLSCLLRGWVEVLEDAVPSSQLLPDGSLPTGPLMRDAKPVYRLTDSGWGVVRGTHTLAVWGMIVALISLAAAVAALAVGLGPAQIVVRAAAQPSGEVVSPA